MPIYEYHCPNCGEDEEVMLPMNKLNTARFHLCGCEMQRLMTIPQPPIMKSTGKGMALESLNSKGTSHMKPETKMAAAKGLENPGKVFY